MKCISEKISNDDQLGNKYRLLQVLHYFKTTKISIKLHFMMNLLHKEVLRKG
jgi:hypothetical protein